MATALPVVKLCLGLRELTAVTHGVLRGDATRVVTSLSTDSRALVPGAVFVALSGARFDGHDHLDAVWQAGAVAAIVARGRARNHHGDGAYIEVDDPLRALADLAAHALSAARSSRELTVAAVSGAVGKTTTKELLRAAFDSIWGPVHATRGNLNNLIGAPLTVLSMTDPCRSLVVECGSNARGEISRIGAMVEPDVAVVTNADAAHTEGLGSIEAVADEEGSLFGFARRAVVANADEPLSFARSSLARRGVARFCFGHAPEADVRVLSRELLPSGKARVTVALGDGFEFGDHRGGGAEATVLTVDTALVGPAAAVNLAAALCVTAAAGASLDALHTAARALSGVTAAPGRLEVRQLDRTDPSAGVVIDDTYNASPRAVLSALTAARELCDARGARLVVALGDMLELGPLSDAMHAEVVDAVSRSGAALLIAVGRAMTAASHFARVPVVCARDSDSASEVLSSVVRRGDVVLVKGSRGVQMERCVRALVGGSLK